MNSFFGKARRGSGQSSSKKAAPRIRLGWEDLEDRTVPAYVPLGAETLVNTFTTGNQQASAMAMDANGNFVVTWESENQVNGSSGKDVYAQRYNAAGTKVGSEFRVNTFTTGDQGGPDIAMDSAGNFTIVWTSTGQDSGSSLGVYAQRYNASGVAQGSEFRLNNVTQYDQFDPSIAMDSSGNFVVVWTSGTDNALAFPAPQDGFGNFYGVYGIRYNSSGVRQGTTEFRVNATTAGFQALATVGADSSGNFVVAWTTTGQESGQGNSSAVYARRYNSAGTALSGEFQVNQTVTGEQFLPDIAVNASGAFVIAWASNQDDPGTERNDLFARRYNNAGTALSNEFKVNTYIPGEQYLHTVGIDTAGNFVVAWSSGYDDVVNPGPELQQDGNMYGVYLQRYFANGTADGGEYQVNQFTTGNQWNPSIAVRASTGNFWISWSSFGQDAANGYGIYQRQYGPNTVPTANAGGPYVINEGGSLTLSGSGTDPDFGQTLTFSWDVNGDGIYGDATGASPTLSWSQLNALGITDGPANRTVRLRTTDGFDTTTSGSTTLTVNNVAPTLGVTVQTAAVRGEVIPIALTSSDPSAADLAGTFIYQFDWNNDNAVDQIINGGSTLNTTYAFANNGTYTFKIRSIDDDGGISGWVSRTVTVTTSRTAPNPNNGSLTDLYIGGLPTDDFIIVGKGSDLGPPYGGSDLFFFNGNSGDGLIIIPNVTGRVIVYLQDGDDIFNPTNIPNATVQFGGNGADVLFGTVQSDTLDGGAGDDILVGSLDGSAAPDLMNGGDGNDFFLADAGSDTINGGNDDDVVLAGDGSNVVDGGAGNDVIVGGEGNDSLLGGTGSDFIVGLGGSDTIRGGAGQDFIIAAYIDDTPEGTAEGVVAEWFSGGSYTSRVNNITGVTNTGLNPYPLVVGVTVFDDGAADTIFGDADEDFFYLDLATDVATDVAVGEVVIDL